MSADHIVTRQAARLPERCCSAISNGNHCIAKHEAGERGEAVAECLGMGSGRDCSLSMLTASTRHTVYMHVEHLLIS